MTQSALSLVSRTLEVFSAMASRSAIMSIFLYIFTSSLSPMPSAISRIVSKLARSVNLSLTCTPITVNANGCGSSDSSGQAIP